MRSRHGKLISIALAIALTAPFGAIAGAMAQSTVCQAAGGK